jgi:hypothetical protein
MADYIQPYRSFVPNDLLASDDLTRPAAHDTRKGVGERRPVALIVDGAAGQTPSPSLLVPVFEGSRTKIKTAVCNF